MTMEEYYIKNDINKIFYENIDKIRSQNTVPFGPLVYGLIHSINPSFIIETGTNSGYLTAWIAKACLELENRVFYTIDWYDEEFSWLYEVVGGSLDQKAIINLEECGVLSGVNKFVTSEVITYLLNSEREGLFKQLPLGMAVIDDNHTKAHVYMEMEIFWRNLAPGGMMVLHDVEGVEEVKDAVNDFISYNNITRRLWFFSSSGCIVIQKDW